MTTIFSHPCDGAGPATAGFHVITVYAGDKGYPEPDAIKAAVSERTAGLMITNPEDTGLFNPHVDEIVEIVHDAGGLCHYDQANANGILDHEGEGGRLRPLPVQPPQDVLVTALLHGDAVRRGG